MVGVPHLTIQSLMKVPIHSRRFKGMNWIEPFCWPLYGVRIVASYPTVGSGALPTMVGAPQQVGSRPDELTLSERQALLTLFIEVCQVRRANGSSMATAYDLSV